MNISSCQWKSPASSAGTSSRSGPPSASGASRLAAGEVSRPPRVARDVGPNRPAADVDRVAQAYEQFLQAHPKVAWVNYPGLEDSPFHGIASRQFGGKFGGLLTFGLASKAEAFRLINGLQLARNLANIGDAKSLAIHPASTICVDYPPEQRLLLGVFDEQVRVSVGLEHYNDIIGDFAQSLDAL